MIPLRFLEGDAVRSCFYCWSWGGQEPCCRLDKGCLFVFFIMYLVCCTCILSYGLT